MQASATGGVSEVANAERQYSFYSCRQLNVNKE